MINGIAIRSVGSATLTLSRPVVAWEIIDRISLTQKEINGEVFIATNDISVTHTLIQIRVRIFHPVRTDRKAEQ